MKRQTLYDLISAHYNKNEKEFLRCAKQVSRDLFLLGEKELSKAIEKLINSHNTITTSKKMDCKGIYK